MSEEKETKEIKVNITDSEETEADSRGKQDQEDAVPQAEQADGDAAAGESVTEGEAEGPTEAEPEEVEEELTVEEKLERQAAETADKLLRVMADFDNYKKRQARLYDDLRRTANDSLLADVLEIVDNFERALEHANGQTDLDAFRDGTQLIYNQMRDLLTRYKVEPIEALGKPFDPNLHEAMMQVPTDEFAEGTVAMEISKGYKHGDRVLRHSKVGVAAPLASEDTAPEEKGQEAADEAEAGGEAENTE